MTDRFNGGNRTSKENHHPSTSNYQHI